MADAGQEEETKGEEEGDHDHDEGLQEYCEPELNAVKELE